MKNLFLSLALTLVSVTSFAAGTRVSTQDVIAAINANQEIAGVVDVVKNQRGLSCEALSEKDVVVKKSGAVKAAFHCNDENGGANVHTLYVSGSAYLNSNNQVVLGFTGLFVQASE